eukprot:SAG31_NODE_685_length_12832_cov_28.355376_7_plen_136_part_00
MTWGCEVALGATTGCGCGCEAAAVVHSMSRRRKRGEPVPWMAAEEKHVAKLKPGTLLRVLGSSCIEMERRRGVYEQEADLTVVSVEKTWCAVHERHVWVLVASRDIVARRTSGNRHGGTDGKNFARILYDQVWAL